MDAPTPPPRHVLTRFVVLRLLGFVYAFAFLSYLRQVRPLLGSDGLLPIDQFESEASAQLGSTWDAVLRLPSVFWLAHSDGVLVAAGWLGLALSLCVLAGYANAIGMAILWTLYLSIVHVGQLFYGYGWEIQLCETGFLAIFLCPLLDPRPLAGRPPPRQVVWLLWWLAARVMLGAGLIKLRGDPCWRDLTCLDFHFETQPLPNPLTPYFHALPHGVHAFGVAFNHVAELACPIAIFCGRRVRHVAAAVMALFQLTLVLSGNLSFLNWLTLVPIVACFDDGLLARVLPRALVARVREAAPTRAQQRIGWGVLALIGLLSVQPVLNLLSAKQVMNTGFDPLELVNTYGAFGSVGRERDELVLEGTLADTPDDRAAWRAYELPCKPGDPARRPCVTSPFQPRLDWQLWFAAMSSVDQEPWVLHLVWKLLHGDRNTLSLFANDPFPDRPPRFIRARFYRYTLARPGEPGWWHRTELGLWMPPLSADDPRLRAALEAEGWLK